MFKEYRKEIEWGGQPLILETGKIARQADGAVMATLGETQVLCTAVYEKTPKPGLDFFPLSVHYQEKVSPPEKFQAASLNARGGRRRRKFSLRG